MERWAERDSTGGDTPVMLGLQIWTEPEGPLRDPDDQAPEIETTGPRLSMQPSTDSLWCTMFQKQVMTSGTSPA